MGLQEDPESHVGQNLTFAGMGTKLPAEALRFCC